METLVVIHEVDDVQHWLGSPKRKELFGPRGISVRPFHDPAADALLFSTIEQGFRTGSQRRLQRLPLVLNWMGRLSDAQRRAEEASRQSRRTQDWAGLSPY